MKYRTCRRTRRTRRVKRTKTKQKDYDLYNGDKWDNYRLGDIIYGQLACYDDFCLDKHNPNMEHTYQYIDWTLQKKWCKEQSSIWTDPHNKKKSYIQQIHTNFPNSIASKYVKMVGFPNNYKIEHIPTIRKIFSSFTYKKPKPSTLVIHLRLGDVLSTYYGNTYAYGYEYYEELLQRIKRNKKIKQIDIVTGLHTNTYVKPSNKMLHRLVKLFEESYPVKVILTKNPDKDFYYMCHSKFFASSGGGFSRLIESYVKKQKGTKIYSNPDIIMA